jgi:hypothetical protein
MRRLSTYNWRHLITAIGVAVVCATAPSHSSAQPRPANFGQQWVRSHPLTLMGLQQWPHTFDALQHRDTNMTSLLNWWADGNGKQTAAISSAANLPWHALIVDGEGDERDRITDYASVGKAAGWMIGDELARTQFPFFGEIVEWTKQNRPNDLAYTNAYPTYAPDWALYGGTPPPGGYSYSQYLEDMVQVMKPDLLMYDHYPYVENLMRHDYFYNMMLVREKALEHNLPYWGFMQSSAHGAYRLPSESDARMQMFSHLTAGFTGMAYFTFDAFGYASILDFDGNPTPLYPIVADLNQEATTLGRALRYLTSEDVKFIAGFANASRRTPPNPAPLGLTRWTAANNEVPHLLATSITQLGVGKDGMIGLFQDDNGEPVFMLTNIHHGPGLSSAITALEFELQFDTSVESLVRLNRETGAEELLMLTNNRLRITIPGGTAELFRFDGTFIVPEPHAACLFGLGAAVMNLTRSRRRRIR